MERGGQSFSVCPTMLEGVGQWRAATYPSRCACRTRMQHTGVECLRACVQMRACACCSESVRKLTSSQVDHVRKTLPHSRVRARSRVRACLCACLFVRGCCLSDCLSDGLGSGWRWGRGSFSALRQTTPAPAGCRCGACGPTQCGVPLAPPSQCGVVRVSAVLLLLRVSAVLLLRPSRSSLTAAC